MLNRDCRGSHRVADPLFVPQLHFQRRGEHREQTDRREDRHGDLQQRVHDRNIHRLASTPLKECYFVVSRRFVAHASLQEKLDGFLLVLAEGVDVDSLRPGSRRDHVAFSQKKPERLLRLIRSQREAKNRGFLIDHRGDFVRIGSGRVACEENRFVRKELRDEEIVHAVIHERDTATGAQ